MSKPDFNVEINNGSVSVRLNGVSPRARLYAFILCFIGLPVLGVCFLLFVPGEHGGPSMWQYLSSRPVHSAFFSFELVLLLITPPFLLLAIWRYTVCAYPSDEILRCDGSTLTVSKARWFDFHSNANWNTRSYASAEIETMRYKAIARVRRGSIYGLYFKARGSNERVLPGLGARDADKILKAFKAFGINVPDDPRLLRKLAETIPGS
ncbi:MAG TPA: hypothetical protein VMB47_15230 [Candidatus Aquilonibacter sp.]|nr:hypothetical protein [Candidatus Aquilonibacter sp.]